MAVSMSKRMLIKALKRRMSALKNLVGGGRSKSKVESHSKSLQNANRRGSSGTRSVTSDPLLGVDPKAFERLRVRLAGMDKWPKKCKENLKKLLRRTLR